MTNEQTLLSAVCSIIRKAPTANPVLATIDGPCASGKTTLAGKLAEEMGCDVLHTDDFVVPHAQKSQERLSVPGGNCDWERLTRDVLAPWKQGQTVRYQRYDCRADCLMPEKRIASKELLILEGSYCNLPAIRAYADIRFFVDTPLETRLERLRRRESPESLERFFSKWIPLENAYFDAYGLPDRGCLIISEVEASSACSRTGLQKGVMHDDHNQRALCAAGHD